MHLLTKFIKSKEMKMKNDVMSGGAGDARRSSHSFVELLKISEQYCNNKYSVVVGLYKHVR